jgi:hypothetical protein
MKATELVKALQAIIDAGGSEMDCYAQGVSGPMHIHGALVVRPEVNLAADALGRPQLMTRLPKILIW